MKLNQILSINAVFFSCFLVFQSPAFAQGCDCSRKSDYDPWVCVPACCMGGTCDAEAAGLPKGKFRDLTRESTLTKPSRTVQPQLKRGDIDNTRLKNKPFPGDQFRERGEPNIGN